MWCGDTMASLLNCLYSELLAQNEHLSNQYFLDCTILNPRNEQVHEVNSIMLDSV